jgi:hypothetical protein
LETLPKSRSAGVESFECDRAAVPVQERGIYIALVARVANPTFAINFKRTGAVDRFAVHLQPRANVFGSADHFGVKIAATVLGEVEQHGSVAAHVLHQRMDDAWGIHVFLSGFVVPIRDAGFSLERIRHDIRFDDGFGALDQGTVNIVKQFRVVLEAVVIARPRP